MAPTKKTGQVRQTRSAKRTTGTKSKPVKAVTRTAAKDRKGRLSLAVKSQPKVTKAAKASAPKKAAAKVVRPAKALRASQSTERSKGTGAAKKSISRAKPASARGTTKGGSRVRKTTVKRVKSAPPVKSPAGSKAAKPATSTVRVRATKKRVAHSKVAKGKAKPTRKAVSTPSTRMGKVSVAVQPEPAKSKPRAAVRPSPAAVRRAKEKGSATSPFSHTDHASIYRGVEARKAAARIKQARMTSVKPKPKKIRSRRLTDKQLIDFEKMLLRIKAELLRQIAYLRGASLTRADEVNPEEDGTDAFERQLALKLAAGEGDSIFEIDEALERIREKTYGVCEDCGCIISTPRLKALPFARRCVECQSKVEKSPNLTDHRYY